MNELLRFARPFAHDLRRPTRWADVYEYIRQYRALFGYGPSIRDIADGLEISSSSVVHYRVRQLVAEGWLLYEPEVARSVRLAS